MKRSAPRVLCFLTGMVLLSSCASSFASMKRKLFDQSDKVIITFYDSDIMNPKAIKNLFVFETEDPFEIEEFRKFILLQKVRTDECRGTGAILVKKIAEKEAEKEAEKKLEPENRSIHKIQFDLDNKCALIFFTGNGIPQSRKLSKKGLEYLEKRRSQIVANN